MKVLVIGHALCPGLGSEPGNTWNFASHLSSQHEVVLISHPAHVERVEAELKTTPRPNLDIRWVQLPKWRDPWRADGGERGVRLHYLLWQREVAKLARQLCAEQHFDVAHHLSLATVNAPPLLHDLPVPIVWGPIGGGQVMPLAFRRYFKGQLHRELLRHLTTGSLPWRPALRRMARLSSAVLVTNEETRRIVERGGARHVEMFLHDGLATGYTDQCTALRPDSRETTFLWAGRCEARKGLPLGLEALARVTAPVRLLVAGDGPLLPAWKDLARRLNVSDRTEFLGRVPWQTMPRLFDESHVFLFTSLRDSYGSVVLEAMGHGLPILTLNHQGVRCFVPREGSIKVSVQTPAQTVAELATGMETLASDPHLRERMGDAALGYARTETWDNRTERIVRLYTSVCGPPAASLVQPRRDRLLMSGMR